MVSVVPASQVKQNFGEVLRRVYEQEETLMIERGGMPVAFLVSVSDYAQTHPERVRSLPQIAVSAKRQQAAKRLRALLDQTQKGGEKFSEEEVEADVMKALYEVRYGKKRK